MNINTMILSGLAIANVNAALSTHSRHFHGPAEAGKNAGVVLPIAPAKSRMEGSATLTDAQAADLAAGKWYVNVHTAANKDGEIRGQVLKDN